MDFYKAAVGLGMTDSLDSNEVWIENYVFLRLGWIVQGEPQGSMASLCQSPIS